MCQRGVTFQQQPVVTTLLRAIRGYSPDRYPLTHRLPSPPPSVSPALAVQEQPKLASGDRAFLAAVSGWSSDDPVLPQVRSDEERG